MIQIPPNSRIFVGTKPIDLRNGIDGIAAICRDRLLVEPMDGAVFIFTNAPRTHIKILFYDGQGFWLCLKRLSKGRFSYWPRSSDESVNFSPDQIYQLIGSADWRHLD